MSGLEIYSQFPERIIYHAIQLLDVAAMASFLNFLFLLDEMIARKNGEMAEYP